MIEVLIVVIVLGILAVILLGYFNPLEKRDRAVDSRRKSDLDRLTVAMEDYYGDNNCYPTPAIAPDYLPCSGDTDEDFHLYLGTIPCDPATGESYYYEPENVDCPQYHRIYTNLKWEDDPQVAEVGCQYGCGPSLVYNYGVSSPNVSLEGASSCSNWCACQGSVCNDVNDACCEDPSNPEGCSISSPKCYCCEGKPVPWCGDAGCP